MSPNRPSSQELGGCGCFGLYNVRICQPNQYLIKTGLWVKEMVFKKKCIQWPYQRVCVIDMNPRNYKFHLNNMSKEMVPFNLPVVFTIGPMDPERDHGGFLTYARLMSGLTEQELADVVAGVVHGQTRVYSAGLTIREMFEDRDEFKDQVQKRIQKDLNQYGLFVYNANIAEMKDLDESNKYFDNLKQKALEGANTEARVEVAEARKQGDIGVRMQTGETTMRVAQIDADVTKNENERLQEIQRSNLKLELVKVECQQKNEQAKVEADFLVKEKQIELQAEYEKKTAIQRLEHLRAMELSQTMVNVEAQVKTVEGQAETVKQLADADMYKEQRAADATLYQERARAEAKLLVADAQAQTLKKIIDAAGSPQLAMFYLSMEYGLYERMAEQTASAIKGLNPKINIWNTGGGAGNGGDGLDSLKNLFTGLPPMLDVIQQQTDIKLPGWLPQAAPQATAGGAKAAVAMQDTRRLVDQGGRT